MKKLVGIMGITILLVCGWLSGCSTNNQHLTGPFFVGFGTDADFQSIQDAIDIAQDGDTIYVHEGKYYETLSINKSINLIQSDEHNSYLIGNNTQLPIIQLNADNCLVDGFIFTRNGNIVSDGINIKSSNNTIINNTITFSDVGIFIENKTQQNIIYWNNISNNHYGIKIDRSMNNTLANNQIIDNSLYGAYIYSNSNNNIIHNNIFYKNSYALRIKSSSYNTVFRNCFINNSWGVYLCCGATLNTAYNNFFELNNQSNVHEDNGLTNYFNSSSDGGNYYDDYKGVDANNDGFGDTPYFINYSRNQDSKPLMNYNGCNADNNSFNPEKNRFVGTWQNMTQNGPTTMILSLDGSCVIEGVRKSWDVQDGTIVIESADPLLTYTYTYLFSNNDTTLTITSTKVLTSTQVFTKQ